jgi:hypothetical protein
LAAEVAAVSASCAEAMVYLSATTWARASSTSARRWSIVSWNGVGSMVASKSPCATLWLSTTCTATMRPVTWGASAIRSD